MEALGQPWCVVKRRGAAWWERSLTCGVWADEASEEDICLSKHDRSPLVCRPRSAQSPASQAPNHVGAASSCVTRSLHWARGTQFLTSGGPSQRGGREGEVTGGGEKPRGKEDPGHTQQLKDEVELAACRTGCCGMWGSKGPRARRTDTLGDGNVGLAASRPHLDLVP